MDQLPPRFTQIRVREVIQHLKYNDLVKSKIIPDILSGITVATKRYSPFVYKNKKFSFFGMLMDYWIRKGLRSIKNINVDLGIDPLSINCIPGDKLSSYLAIYQSNNLEVNFSKCVIPVLEMVRIMYQDEGFDNNDIIKYIPTLQNIVKEVNTKWIEQMTKLGLNLYYNKEYLYENIVGHPDVVTDIAILDIKNTSTFKKMGEEACLQVLTYYAICNNPKIKYGGFIFPMQRDIELFDLSEWDTTTFKNKLVDLVVATQVKNDTLGPELILFKLVIQSKMLELIDKLSIGGHLSKTKSICNTINTWAQQTLSNTIPPIQMFLRNSRSCKQIAGAIEDIKDAAALVLSYEIPYYTHAPYVINLCADATDKDGIHWSQTALNSDLEQTALMFGKGVVCHVGSYCNQKKETALKTMEHMVRNALEYATEECKFLLETPCAEGNEVCTTVREMSDFFLRFTSEERKKLGLCIDTAHIHGAGYKVMDYFEEWEKVGSVPIVLVHYNDSKVCCGSCIDRHEFPGFGHIGYKDMKRVALWCHEKKIDMLRE